MRVFPSLDVRQGSCVQLVGGSLEAERVRLPHPVEVARRWIGLGFRSLHVVDLDAATGHGSNAAIVEEVLAQLPGTEVQVGGGVRDEAGVRHWLEAGRSAWCWAPEPWRTEAGSSRWPCCFPVGWWWRPMPGAGTW